MLYLILLTLWFHKVFKLIFPKSSPWPKTIWWTLEKTSMGNFLGKFSYTFSTTILLRTYEQLLTWICSLSFKRLFWLLYFDLVPPFYFLKWNRFFSTVILVLSESRDYLSYLLPKEVCTNLEIKRFPLMKFWYTICMNGGTDFQSNNIEKHPTHNCLFSLTLLG